MPLFLILYPLITYLLLALLYRLIFVFTYFDKSLDGAIFGLNTLTALYLGYKFDLRLFLITISPLFLLSLFYLNSLRVRNRIDSSKIYKIVVKYFFLLFFFFSLLLFAANFYHYNYLKTSISALSLHLLDNASISLQMVYESYPVIKIFLLFGMTLCLLNFLLNFYFRQAKQQREWFEILRFKFFKNWKRKIGSTILLILLYAFGIYGKFSFYPLRWSEAFFTPSSFYSTLALNPVLYLSETWKFRTKDYDTKLVSKYLPRMRAYFNLGPLATANPSLKLSSESLRENLFRELKGRESQMTKKVFPFIKKEIPEGTNRPNIVIFVMESMVAYKSTLFGSKMEATPALDELAKSSLFFTKYYVPCQATARSVFALLSGVPDLAPRNTSSSRNPMIVSQNSLLNYLDDYDKNYFLGGSANWGQIRGLFTNNIKGVKIFEEGSYENSKNDVWGISDYQLFLEANKILSKSTSPFVAIIQSAGFHRPYTIPKEPATFDRNFFDKRPELKPLLKDYGFESEEEFHSLRFQDFALGEFFKAAKSEKYYANTIFIIFGDHGLPVNNAINVPRGDKIHDLENFHVPLLIHAPTYFSPSVITTQSSEVDILPTIIDLIGEKGKNYPYYAFGESIFKKILAPTQKPLFVYYWYLWPPTYGVIDERYFLRATSEGDNHLFFLDSKDPGAEMINSPLEERKKSDLSDLAHGMYQTGKFLLYNNKGKD